MPAVAGRDGFPRPFPRPRLRVCATVAAAAPLPTEAVVGFGLAAGARQVANREIVDGKRVESVAYVVLVAGVSVNDEDGATVGGVGGRASTASTGILSSPRRSVRRRDPSTRMQMRSLVAHTLVYIYIYVFVCVCVCVCVTRSCNTKAAMQSRTHVWDTDAMETRQRDRARAEGKPRSHGTRGREGRG